MKLRVPLLLLPLAEIAAFILVGQEIGVLATLALVLLSAICGMVILRITGVATLMRIRAEVEARRLPARPLADGAMMALGSLLLIVPGFVTDVLGLLLLVPPVRTALFGWFSRRIVVRDGAAGGAATEAPRPAPTTIELERDDYRSEARPGSPWRRDERR